MELCKDKVVASRQVCEQKVEQGKYEFWAIIDFIESTGMLSINC